MNDLKVQYEQIREEVDAALQGVMDSCSFILGPSVAAFEKAYAAYCQVAHCVGVSNGTDALVLALRAAGVGEGDEVITTPHTFGATAEAICHVGARPVFVDIEAAYFTLDAHQVEARLTARTRAIVPVHIYGHMADMDPLLEIAGRRELVVIEDAAQAQGARHRGRPAGSLGLAGCFSFYPGKNLGAYGDAGGVTTQSDELAARVRSLRNHGQDSKKKFYYNELGYNNRMDGFQGAVLGAKLPHLEAWNDRRRAIAERYRDGLAGVSEVRVPTAADWAHHVYHLFVVRVPDREALAGALHEKGVQTAVQYPIPLHLTPAYADLGCGPGDLPVCERACEEIISLPIYPDLDDDGVDYVVEQVRAFYG
ncbi:MAG: DegT/DnrJ/EryC1/StrS family aminotransferase [Gemmatimonadota bacterium]